MLIHLLISISYSIQRFCLCQPDLLADSCSLEKKCKRYLSQSDIIIYNSQTTFSKNLFPNLNSSQKIIKNEQDNKNSIFDSVLFEVFGSKIGSKKNSPISINMLDEMFSNISKLTIFGGEFNQVIHIKNMNNPKISFEAQNIQVIFDDNDAVSFDKLSLRNSYLKFENSSELNSKSKLIVEAHEVIGDSNSLSSNYFSLIKTCKLQVTDKKEQNVDSSNNFGITAPVEIVDSGLFESKITKKAKKILDDSPTNRFENYFCLSTQSRYSRAKELSECDAYSVPAQNYYTGRDQTFLNLLANAKENADIRIYITLSTEEDPIRINIPDFINNNIKISFIAADVDTETRMEVKGRANSSIDSIESKSTTLIVSKINYFYIDSSYLESFFNVQLYQSPIYITDARSNTTIQNLTTDATSISQFTGTNLTVKQNMQIYRAVPVTIAGKVFLEVDCVVEVNQYSAFPITRYNYNEDLGAYYLTLSDAIEDQRLDLYLNGRIVMNYTESASIANAPTLTFAGGKTLRQSDNNLPEDLRKNCPYMNFTITSPEVGLVLNFGSGSERETAFPHQSVFTIYSSTTQPSDLNLTISDFTSIGSDVTDNFVLAFVGPFNLNIMTPSTIPPYLQGVNKRYELDKCIDLYNCGEKEFLPPFINISQTDINCYQVGGYGLSLINLDVQEKLESVSYKKTAVLVGLKDYSTPEKFPKIAKLIEITSNTNDTITFSIDKEDTMPDNITSLQLNLKGDPTLIFNETYNDAYNSDFPKYYEDNEAMARLTINHESNNLLLIGEGIPVPLIQINDPIKGVLFESNETTFPFETVTSDTFTTNNTRYGPVVNAKISGDVTFPQEAILAEEVIFDGPSTSTLLFQYRNPSRSNYTFNNIKVSFTSESKRVDFKGKRFAFCKSTLSQDAKEIPLTIDVDEFYTDNLISILETSVSGPVLVNKSLIVDLQPKGKSIILDSTDTIKQVVFGDDTVTFVNQDGQKSAQFKKEDPNAQTTISTNQESEIQLSVEDDADSVPSNLDFNFGGNSANLNFDKSWSNVDIPPTFITNFTGMNPQNVHLKTEMMSIPNINIEGVNKSAIQTTTHKRKLTKDLAFWIFVGITALVFVVGLILCIVGLTCCKHVEELDISSSAEGNSDIAIGEVDGLPLTAAEIEERERNKPLIKDERKRLIRERRRKKREDAIKRRKEEEEARAKRKKLIQDGVIEEEDLGEPSVEEKYPSQDEELDILETRSEIILPTDDKKQKKQKKKKLTETSEEFDLAKKKAQLNAASGGAPAPTPAPPPKASPEAQVDNDYESDSQDHVSEFSASD